MIRDDRLCERFKCGKRIDPALEVGMEGGKVCRIVCLRTICGFVNCFGCEHQQTVPDGCLFFMEMLMTIGGK